MYYVFWNKAEWTYTIRSDKVGSEEPPDGSFCIHDKLDTLLDSLAFVA